MIDSRSVCLQNCFHIAFQIADLIVRMEINDRLIGQAIVAQVRLAQLFLAPLKLAQVMIRVALNLFRIPSLCQPQ